MRHGSQRRRTRCLPGLNSCGLNSATMGLRGWSPLPPGLMLDPGDQLGVFELLAEWIAYLYESRFDQLLQSMILACLYDALWTPCLFLLPMVKVSKSEQTGLTSFSAYAMSRPSGFIGSERSCW